MKTLRHLPLLLLPLALAGCPDTGIVCRAGTDRCGQGCADYQTDSRNCGACGVACSTGQVCQAGACVCQPGAQSCGGQCVVTQSDARHCGGCGQACAADQLCEQGQCVQDCTLGTTVRCGTSCVNLETDPSHCGACGKTCEDSQTCHRGSCSWDLVAACFSTGQLTGLNAQSGFRGPRADLGTAPAALASYADTLLVADGIDRALYQARLAEVSGQAFAQYPRAVRLGAVPNQVLVDAPFVYVVNAQTGTLQVLERDGQALPDGGEVQPDSDGGFAQGGVGLVTVAELPFGANTWPQGVAKVGTGLWVPLYGGYGATAAAEGQKVVRVSVANPRAPVVTDTVDLSAIDLKAFDGGAPVARPWAIAAKGTAVYVALNNLNPDTYAAEGPGLLARIDTTSKAVTVLDLGADACLNATWVAAAGDDLLVTCAGSAVYAPPTYALTSVEKAGAVLVDTAGTRKAVWAPECPADAGLADGGTTCPPVMPGRFTVANGRAWVADQNGGRIFVLDVGASSLTERHGYAGSVGGPVQACALDPVTGIANVADVLAVP